MSKRILIAAVVVLLLPLLLEGIALVHEKQSVAKFADYWKAQNKAASGTLTYVALGDSTAQGIGAGDPQDSYAGILAARIAKETGQKVRFINLSKSGAKISDALDTQLSLLAHYKPDIVTIEIGANDLAIYDSAKFKREFSELVARLPAGTFISNMPYFGGRIRKNPTALSANKIITTAVAGHGLQLVDLQAVTKDRQSYRNYAADLFHPSGRGYLNWADAFWEQIQPTLK